MAITSSFVTGSFFFWDLELRVLAVDGAGEAAAAAAALFLFLALLRVGGGGGSSSGGSGVAFGVGFDVRDDDRVLRGISDGVSASRAKTCDEGVETRRGGAGRKRRGGKV